MFSFFSVSVSTVTVASHQLDLTIRFTLDRYLSKETSTVESCACNHNLFIFFWLLDMRNSVDPETRRYKTTRHIYDSLPVFYIQCLLLLDQRELYIHQWRWSTDILKRAFLTKSYWQIESIFRVFLFNLRKKGKSLIWDKEMKMWQKARNYLVLRIFEFIAIVLLKLLILLFVQYEHQRLTMHWILIDT